MAEETGADALTQFERLARDPRTLDVLIAAAFSEAEREKAGEELPAQGEYSALAVLHQRGTRDVLEAASFLCKSSDPERRKLGAQILGQLGSPERTFPEECCDALLALVQQDRDPAVVIQAIYALGHLGHGRAVPVLAALQNHRDGEARRAVAFSLNGHDTTEAISALMHLARDRELDVRDWATTGIAECLSIDGPPVRALLLERAVDDDEIIRAEALTGLARRRDSRVLPYLRKELPVERGRSYLFEDAAKVYLGWSNDRNVTREELIAALDNDSAP